MSGNQPTDGRTGYVIPDRLWSLPAADRIRIVNEHRGRIMREIDRDDDVFIARSIRASSTRIAGALALPCKEHGVTAGAFCFGDARSGVGGLCRARYSSGLRTLPRRELRYPEELAELAQATRLAFRDARIRANKLAAAPVGVPVREVRR
jgi:hypothetical protein